ncbi:MAG: hypothetical protein ACLUI3_09235 [Christensenellales bacterium]
MLGEKAGADSGVHKVRQDIGVVLDEACLPDELTAQQVGKMMHGIYANWDDAAFFAVALRAAGSAEGQEGEGFFARHEDEAGDCRRAEPQGEAARTGRGDRRP